MNKGVKHAMINRISFIELPVTTLDATKSFYASAFGFEMTDFGPTYSCTMSGVTDLGLQADAAEAPRAPLPVIQVAALEEVQKAVEGSGGIITKQTFSFPGGRRFHFRDPSGNEMAAMQAD